MLEDNFIKITAELIKGKGTLKKCHRSIGQHQMLCNRQGHSQISQQFPTEFK